MSAYEPPTDFDPIFNSLAFQTPNDASLTLAEGDLRYLARQNVATSVASSTSFTGPLSMNNQQINNVSALTSLNSPTASLTISNSSANTGGMVIQNANTASNIRYNQFGTASSHIFSTNNTATTNLTLSNTINTSSLPFAATFPSAGSATRTISATDSTSGKSLAFIPSSIGGNLGRFVQLNDTQIVALGGGGVNSSVLSIGLWADEAVGIRITPTQLNLGAGGLVNSVPTSGILFGSTSGNAAMTGTFTFSNDIILRATQPTNADRYLGYNVKQLGTNTAAVLTGVAYNINSTGLSITPGVYIFNFSLVLDKVAAASGDINAAQIGISTNSANFVSGANAVELVHGFQSYIVSGANQPVIAAGSLTFSVPTTATYYCLLQLAHTLGATGIIGTTGSYWQYTRVA